jgi:UDP-N-acetylglucosamine 2-epimerase (non-hydrolysing)
MMNVTAGRPPVRVLVLIGTRPEAIKMLPVVLVLRESVWFEPVVVTTGQHRDLVDPILELGAVEPDVDLGVGRPGLSLNDLVATVITQVDAFCRERFDAEGRDVATPSEIRDEGFPAAALVHGDTSSALAAAIAAFNLRIPVIHVEAGLRTRLTLSPYPEELNRQVIARIASFHLAPTTANEENLIQESVPHDQIFVTGNTGIDALRFAAGLDVEFDDPRVSAAVSGDSPVVTVTAHRRENWHGGLASIGQAIAELAGRYRDTEFVVPLHPNPVVSEELGAPLDGHSNVILCSPLSYAPFARLLARSILVITDSGGIQEEAPALGVPVLVTRDTTERGEGVEAGTLRLVGTDSARIVEEASLLLSDPGERSLMATSENPYGDGRAADRILAALAWLAGVGPPPVRFGPGFSRKAVLSAAGYRGSIFGAVVGEERGAQPDRFEELDRWVAG